MSAFKFLAPGYIYLKALLQNKEKIMKKIEKKRSPKKVA